MNTESGGPGCLPLFYSGQAIVRDHGRGLFYDTIRPRYISRR